MQRDSICTDRLMHELQELCTLIASLLPPCARSFLSTLHRDDSRSALNKLSRSSTQGTKIG